MTTNATIDQTTDHAMPAGADPSAVPPTTQRIQVAIRATPQQIWQALTDGSVTPAYYLGFKADFDLTPGAAYRYTAGGGDVITGWDDQDYHLPGTADRASGERADGHRVGLVSEALRLSSLLTELLPDDAEVHGLRALLLHSDSRSAARRNPTGGFVPLDQHDVRRWSRAEIGRAERHLAIALDLHRKGDRLGQYQVQAAIQSVHNRRVATGRTDWAAVATLYDGLVVLTPTVGAFVARAKAHSHTAGPAGALALLDELPAELVAHYQPYWVVRAYCCRGGGDAAGAALAAETAMALTADAVVRSYLSGQYVG